MRIFVDFSSYSEEITHKVHPLNTIYIIFKDAYMKYNNYPRHP
jgi:hypothetical protein